MSWAEVKKLNSDFVNEPLNFSHYVSDISLFGANSYVLDTSNIHLWRLLLKDSLAMFGHDAIHTVVYNRLSNTVTTEFDDEVNDCDYTLSKNGRLGQCFNGFYNTNVFSPGKINAVLKTMTNEKFNILEVKWQQSICRYLTLHTSGTSGVGAWLAEVYAEPSLVTYPTLQSILSDTTLWASGGVLATNEPLRVGCCSSSVGIEYVGTQSTATWFNDYINTISNTTITTTELWDLLAANSALDAFWTNATASGYVFDKATSMTALIYHPQAFRSLCGSTAGIATLCNHTAQYTVLFNGWNTAGLSELKLVEIRSTMATLNTLVSQMPAESHNIIDIAAAQAAILTAINSLISMNGKADVMVSNFDALNTSSVAWQGIASSQTAVNAIIPNSTAMTKIAASLTALRAMLSVVYNVNTINESDNLSIFVNSSLLTQSTTSLRAGAVGSTNLIADKYPAWLVTSFYSWDSLPGDSGGSGTATWKINGGVLSGSFGYTGSGSGTTSRTLNKFANTFTYASSCSGSYPQEAQQRWSFKYLPE